ncbi:MULTISPECIES: bifunctional 23S rRNA (guanine(2069)-N(7))-methyltransferase RlmK/23S rRNA (guanine(2445)-N(2))-methyltransferase RlmL [Halomonadaceae]|jgi:23S rRNA (guanine2445-N2)-methyltransferase / 23S rRNA (guanine2069-N7)-methyltransferase|uniref:bifunctional 23S rRNA (guanine(2069)-N(7))-methyltransferase RlmK/23S rRNA (guanine(2445)-N(2))-methyltransferase RlmL n=1 Tax=Halomonadaceae TaxID=28256 RepID=UPI0012F27463|nr:MULTISPECIES: bifunctional 23S rRNA (guanine(2069)-N(7))-methyltransferase RlmK/23S rRNA (guanine(2445)-N(2))-methyltransferase RlmL [Halomonas]CAD5269130.1 putative conserved AdoMet-dependent methyltransferase with RNA interaction domain [Halomonas sp. 156]CAD5281643.1 putative conserved AdoMet-dependent methyltransferase with RNA interaction domain [Halomonas sp. 113]CAD5282991.1 putative conserved AdoMet-dependent methyltransferase with RNA interaction domain [Halomonas sp. 59]CAD5289148.
MTELNQNAPLSLLATCPKGIEGLLHDELVALGATPGKTTVAGVYFTASQAIAYRVCLWSRLANRVILTLVRESMIDTAEQVRDVVARIAWTQHLAPGNTLAVDFHGRSEHIRHTRFGAQTVKDGVVDALQLAGQERPNVDTKTPHLRIYAHLHRMNLTIGLDLSGESLHRRGYRRDVGHAPLKENLAAALLVRAGWPERLKVGEPLIDPLCGAGTLLIEAAMMAADQAPNLNRERFGFHGWAGHDDEAWREQKREAEARASIGRKRCKAQLLGFDQSPAALTAAKSNAMRAGIPALITLHGQSLAQLTRPETLTAESGLLITNPPYGERLGELPELVRLYAQLGDKAKALFPGWTLAVFTGNPDLGHRLGMRAHKQYALKNGPLEARLLLMEIGGTEHPPAASDTKPVQNENSAVATPSEEASEEQAVHKNQDNAQMFANRLIKNQKRLKKWLKQSGETSYRVYDADMPEYALAVDRYGDRVHVQEYAAPSSINPAQAQKRLYDALEVMPEALNVDASKIYIKRRERQTGSAQYQKRAASGERFEVQEGKARLWINLRDYLDTGLFLDHRPVRRMLGEMASGKRFLNLFCYTATATVQAALGGASDSVSVDMSNTYLEWAKDNFALNKLDTRLHRVVRDDCFRWLETANAEFDLIFMDPPTFSNSKKMRDTLDVQRDHPRLVELAMARLAPGGTLVFSNNQRRFKLDEALSEHYAVEDITGRSFDPDFQRRTNLHHVFLLRHKAS